jgi:hypothetical protein
MPGLGTISKALDPLALHLRRHLTVQLGQQAILAGGDGVALVEGAQGGGIFLLGELAEAGGRHAGQGITVRRSIFVEGHIEAGYIEGMEDTMTTWSIESANGTQIAGGMDEDTARRVAQATAARTGQDVYLIGGEVPEEFRPDANVGTYGWVQAAESDEEFERRLAICRARKRLEFERQIERAKATEGAGSYKVVR